jgi:hypothetical protein
MDTPRQANVRMMNIRRHEQKRDSGRAQPALGSGCAAPTPDLNAAAHNAPDPVSRK